MSDKKYKEFWIDSLPIFNGDDIVSWKRAYTNEQDGFEKHKGNELYHVIEYSAYEQLKSENEVLKRELADERSGDCDKDKTIRRLQSNFKVLEEQNKVLIGLVEAFNGAITREIDGCFRIDSHSVKDIKKAIEAYEAWKLG